MADPDKMTTANFSPAGGKANLFKRILGLLALLVLIQPVQSHYKSPYHVIIDTDGGVDDFRAICMMLASPEIEVIAITTVKGVLEPELTASKIRSLLMDFGHQGIPVGVGGSVPLILESLELEDMPVDIAAMGPMSNLAALLREDPGVPGRVRRVYWNNPPGDKKAFNYSMDPGSALDVLASGFSLYRCDAGGIGLGSCKDFLRGLDTLSTIYAAAVRELYRSCPEDFTDTYLATRLGDDCIPLYMLYGDSIDLADPSVDPAALILGMLDGDREDRCIVFSRFPTDPGLFGPDVAAIAGQILETHGLKEWKIVVLTNEFHEHLGIYSILGAKMGLRAREYFHVGIDELEIVSFAGSKPPLSCLNDGLQVSTGATLGHGTIRLGEGTTLPEACFTFKNRVIRLSVRKEIRERIREDVSKGVEAYGPESPEYWEYIRELALGCWLGHSRFDIFEISELPAGPESADIPAR